MNYLREMSYSWRIDSMGSLGLRSILFSKIEDRCGIVGMKWEDIDEFFGKPNIEGSLVSSYNLRYYSKIDSTFNYPVLEYISIDLDNERKKVIGFRRRFIDPW